MLKYSITLFFFITSGLFSAENGELTKFDCSTLHKNLFSCLSFSEDVASHIAFHFFTPDSADLYGTQLQTLALINKKNGAFVSAIPKDIAALRKFIEDASGYFQCSNEKITSLPWKSARQIMFIQGGLFNMCHNPHTVYFKDKPDEVGNARMLEKLCQESDVNFNFTYGQDCTTPFMALCASPSRCENDEAVRQLRSFFVTLAEGGFVDRHAINTESTREFVNLNAVNSEGRNGFMISLSNLNTHWVMESFFLWFIFDDKTLKPYKKIKFDIDLININEQDNNGDTALHIYFCGDWIIKTHYIDAFIAAGADPEIKNKKGMTPLQLLEQLEKKDRERFGFVPEYFKQVVEKKKKGISC